MPSRSGKLGSLVVLLDTRSPDALSTAVFIVTLALRQGWSGEYPE